MQSQECDMVKFVFSVFLWRIVNPSSCLSSQNLLLSRDHQAQSMDIQSCRSQQQLWYSLLSLSASTSMSISPTQQEDL